MAGGPSQIPWRDPKSGTWNAMDKKTRFQVQHILSHQKKKLNQVSWKNFGKNYNTSSRKGHQVMFAHQIHQF